MTESPQGGEYTSATLRALAERDDERGDHATPEELLAHADAMERLERQVVELEGLLEGEYVIPVGDVTINDLDLAEKQAVYLRISS